MESDLQCFEHCCQFSKLNIYFAATFIFEKKQAIHQRL